MSKLSRIERYVEVVEELKLWERQYDLLSASVLEKFPEIFPEGCCSFQEYKWARHMIESRAWHLRGKQHLAPMADFFNHEPLPSMTYDTEPDEVRVSLFGGGFGLKSVKGALILFEGPCLMRPSEESQGVILFSSVAASLFLRLPTSLILAW